MKKIFKILAIVLGVVLLALIAAPFLFRSQLEDLLKRSINENLNATVDWEEFDLTLFSSFPDATVQVKNFTVINHEPFAGDTLAAGELLELEMGVKQLFKTSTDKPIAVDAIALDRAYVNIKVDSLGNANYDIAKENPGAVNDTLADQSGSFVFEVQEYAITNSRINYLDESTKTYLRLREVNHEGSGDFSADVSNLTTKTNALASFDFDGVNYLNQNKIALDAVIEMNLPQQRYTFKENEALVNQLPLVFEGFVQVNETNNELDLSFKTPSSDFKNFLQVIPEVYAKNLDGVTTTGDFIVNGRINGVVDEERIPMLNIEIQSNNASFKYPNLPKTVQDIIIDARIVNETGNVDDTYLGLNNLNFRIDQDVFNAKGTIKRLTTNALIDLALKGRLNLANLEKAYPLELEQDINGMLTVDMTTSFDMESVDKEQYQNIKSSGTASLKDFKYVSPELPNALNVAEANLSFNPGTISLQNLEAQTGKTDLSAKGSIENLIPFLLSKQNLKGRFTVNSNTVDLADFSVVEEPVASDTPKTQTAKASAETAIKIPSFLDAGIDFAAGTVIYDNITLKNVKGNLSVADETARLTNIQSDLFGGRIALTGNVSTKTATPTFGMDLNLSSVSISESFEGLEMFQQLAPIAKALQGALNTTITLNGNLNDDLTPVLTSLAGNALAQLLTVEVNPEKMKLLQLLDTNLEFINLDRLDLSNLKTQFSFQDGLVTVKPFDFNIKGINVGVSGTHSLENTMNYTLNLDVPGTYLGSKLGGALAGLSNQNLDQYTVDLPIKLTGSFTNPQVGVNTQQAVSSLTQQIIATQKEKLGQQGEDKIKDVLGGILGGGAKPKDSTQTGTTPTKRDSVIQNTASKAVKDVLGSLFGKKKTVQDSTKSNN
ncbi:AsmA-like C-terminal region-containing protein [Leeuwenhoekiella nanhaiensis]|uniref:AsmA family protein n=1 Tax=Leeuwenhoekiella nanhaiensis TaxID=1655491 RepID=A0A2G1VT72_9FLAO|nr:AsmA-like C-terminal region-containing protein [Leeuwenhoekiella nanhaiensis]PHQ29944.1 AsmA family protein [Leeuwenhoekiella nanhaiensis]